MSRFFWNLVFICTFRGSQKWILWDRFGRFSFVHVAVKIDLKFHIINASFDIFSLLNYFESSKIGIYRTFSDISFGICKGSGNFRKLGDHQHFSRFPNYVSRDPLRIGSSWLLPKSISNIITIIGICKGNRDFFEFGIHQHFSRFPKNKFEIKNIFLTKTWFYQE